MTTSGFLKLSGLCIVLALTGIGFFALHTSRSRRDPGVQDSAPGKAVNASDSLMKIRHFNETAHFLAGMQAPEDTADLQQVKLKEWKAYAKSADSNWAKFYRHKLDHVSKWRIKEIPPAMDTIKTLFYPFGGPDFIFADAFFPDAEKYILFGLEPPGNIPEPSTWNEQNMKSSLAILNKAIDDVTSIGFFRTNDMKVDLETSSVSGVTPILMLFLARSGHTITDVIPGEMNPEGEFHPVKEFQNIQGGKSYGTAVEIRFVKNKTGKHKSLIYFATDISDKGLGKNPGCLNFIGHVPQNCLTLIKSASYLMHQADFSIIRRTILGKSCFILQDDTGIPYHSLKKSTWQIRLFGTYSRTIDLFKHKYQEDLKEAYDSEEKPAAVPFQIGYNVKFNETNLLMATRKERIK